MRTTHTASAWLADTTLRVVRSVRRFNATQLELHEQWHRRYGLSPVSGRPNRFGHQHRG